MTMNYFKSLNSIKHIAVLILSLVALGCGPDQASEEVGEETAPSAELPPIEVKIKPAQRKAFPLQIVSTGVITAARQIPLLIETTGKVEQMILEEGSRVEKGELLLSLDQREQELQLEQAYLSLDDADVSKKDLLLSNGGQAEVDTSVSPEKLRLILTMSGYDRAKHAIQLAQLELAKTQVYAPFAGLVANVKVKPFQQLSLHQELCTLIDPLSFEVHFKLLEKEALQVKKGQTLLVQALSISDHKLQAQVKSINPMVDEQGLVSIKASLKTSGKSKQLFDGMQVKIILEKYVVNQLTIPKSAVVLRSNKEVVFSYNEQDQLAKWHYVTLGYENDQFVTITEGLKEEDWIIYEGNLNLDHDALVKVIESD